MSDSQLGATPDIDNETPGDEDTPEAFTPALGTTGSADEVFTNAEDDEGNLDWGHLFDDFMNLNTPCPHRFLYVFDGEPGKWTGVVSLIAEEDIIGVNLRLLLDSKPKDLEVGTAPKKLAVCLFVASCRRHLSSKVADQKNWL